MPHVNEILDIEIEDTTIDISIEGGGSGIGSTVSEEDLHRYAYNIALNAFRLAQLMNSTFFQMQDGILDFFTDQEYVDLVNSENQVWTPYFGTAYYYKPEIIGVVPQNMVLRSVALDSNGVSGECHVGFLIEEMETIILNTDIKAFASRDGGTTWTEAVLEVEGNQLNNFKVVNGYVDFMAQPEDLHVCWKIETYNNKNVRIHASSMNWL